MPICSWKFKGRETEDCKTNSSMELGYFDVVTYARYVAFEQVEKTPDGHFKIPNPGIRFWPWLVDKQLNALISSLLHPC